MLLLSLLAALFLQAAPQNNPGVIEGRIVRVDGTEGVPGVPVLLVGPATGGSMQAIVMNPLMAAEIADGASLAQVTTTTSDDGRFSFKNLAPGLYTIRALREGYFGVAVTGGPVTSPMATATVTLAAAQPTQQVTLKMARGVTISGRVLDPKGRALPNLPVSVFQVNYSDGRAVLAASNTKSTDDRGEFRIFWLPPGEYFLAATPPRASVADGRPDAYARTYYPSATDALSSRRLTIVDGQDLSGIDITLQATSTVTVSGQVINNLPGATPQTGPFSSFFLLPRDLTTLTDLAVPSIFNERPSQTGQFELRGIPAGSYDLVTTAPDSQGRVFPGRVRIDLSSQNVENVRINIRPGVEVKARVTLDGQPVIPLAPVAPQQLGAGGTRAPLAFQLSGAAAGLTDRGNAPPSVRLQLRSREAYPTPFDSAAATGVAIDASGMLVFPNVPESVYSVQVSGTLPANAYVADIREKSVSIYDSGIAITGPSPDVIEVILASGGSSIKGTLQDTTGKSLPNAVVVLVPQASRRGNPALFKNVRTGFDGSFTFTAVPPGEYKVFGWYSVFNVPSTAYMNAEFLAKFESRGKSVMVASGVNPIVALTVIPND